MFNNGYTNPYYTGYMPNYSNYGNPQMQQRPVQQAAQQPVAMQTQDLPFREVRYGTLDEAKGHIVFPMTSTMFIDRTKGEVYIKSANNLGEPSLETFKYTKTEKYSSQPVSPELDPKELVKTDDLKNFITFQDLEGKNFVTKQDLADISRQIEQLQKKIEIKDILKGEDKNGRQEKRNQG